MNLEDLKAPFPVDGIHWRVGRKSKAKDKAVPFAYLDARDVMERLDAVCGMGGWQCRYPFAGCCEIGIKVSSVMVTDGIPADSEWVWKANAAGQTGIEAEKGQASDAFKRAAVLWGIGAYLYNVPNTWVPVGEYGFERDIIRDLTARLAAWQTAYFKKSEKAA
jgi:hypothetical protein